MHDETSVWLLSSVALTTFELSACASQARSTLQAIATWKKMNYAKKYRDYDKSDDTPLAIAIPDPVPPLMRKPAMHNP